MSMPCTIAPSGDAPEVTNGGPWLCASRTRPGFPFQPMRRHNARRPAEDSMAFEASLCVQIREMERFPPLGMFLHGAKMRVVPGSFVVDGI